MWSWNHNLNKSNIPLYSKIPGINANKNYKYVSGYSLLGKNSISYNTGEDE